MARTRLVKSSKDNRVRSLKETPSTKKKGAKNAAPSATPANISVPMVQAVRSSDRRKVPVDRLGLSLKLFELLEKPKVLDSKLNKSKPVASTPVKPKPSPAAAAVVAVAETKLSKSKSADAKLIKSVVNVDETNAPKRQFSLVSTPPTLKQKSAAKSKTPAKPKERKKPEIKKKPAPKKSVKKPAPKPASEKKQPPKKPPQTEPVKPDETDLDAHIDAIIEKVLADFLSEAETPSTTGKTSGAKSTKKRKLPSEPETTDKGATDQSAKSKKRSKKSGDQEIQKPAIEEPPAAPPKKKGKVDHLTPRPELTEYNVDPTFETKLEIPFVSVTAYSKLTIRAVLTNNEGLLKRLIDDVKHVHDLRYNRSFDVPVNALQYALFTNNAKMLQMLLDYEKKPKAGRVQPMRSLLERQSVGQSNFHMLGHAVRPIQMSRGGKQGINALTHVEYSSININIPETLERNVSYQLLQQLILQNSLTGVAILEKTHYAVRMGHRKLAGTVVKDYNTGNCFNELHQQVLLNDNEQLKPFKPVSVKKKATYCQDMTPFHCACVNPNAKYLTALMAVESDYSHADRNGFRPIHYAAACDGVAPLKLLLEKGASLGDLNKQGESALHRACMAGRTANVQLLVRHAKGNDTHTGMLLQKTRYGYAPLHLAVMYHHKETAEALLDLGVQVDHPAGTGVYNVTALMMAARCGDLDIVKMLLNKGASSIKRDKLKRSPLLHATMNGMAHVCSLLLRLGVDANAPDSSGNSPAHYAAAYGWYFCLKLLIDAGAVLNAVNDWQLTPLAVAYMKGHMALADMLLQQPGIEINCRDDNGMTLVALTLLHSVDESTADQLTYLIDKRGGDPRLTDSMSNTPLHILAAANVQVPANKQELRKKIEAELPVQIAKLLVDRGVDINAVNESNATAMTIAIESGKMELTCYLAEAGTKISLPVAVDKKPKANLIHHVINQLDKSAEENVASATTILKVLIKQQKAEVLEMLNSYDENGFTPLLLAVSHYLRHVDFGEQSVKKRTQLLDLITMILENFPETILQRIDKEEWRSSTQNNQQRGKNKNENDENEDDDDEEEEDKSAGDEDDDDQSNQSDNSNKYNRRCVSKSTNQDRNVLHLMANQIANTDCDKNFNPLMQVVVRHVTSSTSDPSWTGQKFVDAVDNVYETPLFAAIRTKQWALADELISLKANINFARHKPLDAKQPDAKARQASSQYDYGEREKDERFDEEVNDVTLLIQCVEGQNVTLAKRLLTAGANVNAADSRGDTALHYASAKGSASTSATVVECLLTAGAKTDARNKRLRTPLHLACAADNGGTDDSTETLQTLLSRGADVFAVDCRQRIPLHYAFVKIGDYQNSQAMDPIALCTVLLPFMSAKPAALNGADRFGQTPLHCAAKRGSNICCLTLLRHKQVDVNAKDSDGNTPLGLAVMHNHVACALTLLQAGADVTGMIREQPPTKPKTYGWTWAPTRQRIPKLQPVALSSAVVNRDWQNVVYVLVDVYRKLQQPLLPLLEAAVEHVKYNLALTLLRMMKDDKQLAQRQHQQRKDRKSLFQMLADSNVSQKTVNDMQLTVAKALLDTGIPINVENDFFHPTFYASQWKNLALLTFLLEHSQPTVYLVARKSRHTMLSMFFWNLPEDGKYSSDQWQIVAMLLGRGEKFDILCDYPCPVDQTALNVQLSNFWSADKTVTVSPLIHAIQGRNFGLVRAMVKAGADVNFADADGVTPLMHAVRANHLDIVRVLLNNDYNPPEKDRVFYVTDWYKTAEEENEADDDNDDEEQEEDDEGSNEGSQPEASMEQDDASNSAENNNLSKSRQKKLAVKSRAFNLENSLPVPLSQLSGDLSSLNGVGSNRKVAATAKSKTCDSGKLNVNAKDKRGRNVLHYLTAAFPHGTWAGADLWKIILETGADRQCRDADGQTPADYALQHGLRPLADPLITSDKTVGDNSFAFEVVDDAGQAVSSLPSVNLEADAAAYLTKKRQQKAEEKQRHAERNQEQARLRKLRPYKDSGYETIGEIVVDADTENTPFDVLLNQVDMKQYMYGSYNFYRMQLIRRKGSELYILFTQWGRIGSDGQYQKTPFGNLAEASKEFRSIFRQKTGTDWANVRRFEPQPNKYRLIDRADEDRLSETVDCLDVEINLDNQIKSSSLPKQLQTLMSDLVNVSALTDTARHLFSFQSTVVTTALQRETLMRALSVLETIGDLLKDNSAKAINFQNKEEVEAALQYRERLIQLSTEFYFLLPMTGFERSALTIISDVSEWTKYKDRLENLLKIEVANELLCAAAQRQKEVHPHDYIYKAIDMRMQLLDPDQWEAQTIVSYFEKSYHRHRVNTVYKLFNRSQHDRFVEKARTIGNRRLLWHGTDPVNVLSIMRSGLLIAPPQALHSGHLFGKGVYFSDAVRKSAHYCSKARSGLSYMFLCEVALGKTAGMFYTGSLSEIVDPLPVGHDSVQGIGQIAPDPSYDFTLRNGVTLPLGDFVERQVKGQTRWYFRCDNNEFIVYDTSQVALRYLVVFKE